MRGMEIVTNYKFTMTSFYPYELQGPHYRLKKHKKQSISHNDEEVI